ncbi:MAG: hypothetical protein V3U84_06615 [Thiotrichaceae bacterium]
MLSDKASLDARVGWIKQEIEQQLKQIDSDLESYSNSRANDNDGLKAKKLLEQCRDTLAEIMLTMKMTGVQGGERLALEMHALIEDLIAERISDYETSLLVLKKGSAQIGEYLQHLQDGYADLPVVILPLLNELRAARGSELLSELLVFLPEEGAISHSQIGTDEHISIALEKREQTYRHLRMHFQQALLAWFNEKNTDKALQKIQTLSHDLIKIHEPMSVRVLWWLSQALAEALRENKLDHGVAVKLVMGNMERLIAKFSQTDVNALEDIAEINDIKKNLLYYIGMAEKGSEHVDRVKEAFLLDVYLPQGETLEKLRKHYASPGQQLWRSVSAGVNEDIDSIMEGFQSMELNPDAGIIQLIIDKSRKTATTLGMLGLGKLATIIDKQVDEFKIFKKNPQNFKQDRRLEIATEWLRVKDILEEYAETGEDVTHKLFGDDGQYQVSDYSARKKVLQVVESKLSSAVENLNEYANNPHIDLFISARESMCTVDNTLKFLGHEETYPLTEGAISYLEKYSQENSETPEPEQMNKLAEALAALETSVIALRNNAEHLTSLQAGYESIRELHKLCILHEGIEQQIKDVVEGNHALKKFNRQKKMDLILAV